MAFVPPVIDFNFKISGDQEIARRFAMAGSSVKAMVRDTLKVLALQVRDRARSLAPRDTGRLATRIGYRFTMGRSGVSKDKGDRVVVRADIGTKGFEKAKSYAVEMGQLGRRKKVQAYQRRKPRTGIRHSVGSGSMTQVGAYTRRFANKAQPFLGPAGEQSRPDIEQALMVALPRRLARIMQTGEAAP
jgi:HK97 gp10 family phage protein